MFEPSQARRGLDLLLARHPHLDLLRVEWQVEPGDVRSAAHWAGPWVLVDLGQPSELVDVEPAWALWRFAIWRTTGAVYRLGADGAVVEGPILEPETGAAARFTCPVCGRTSYNSRDVDERWCGACQWATGYPPPPGLRMVRLEGGRLDGVGRLMPEAMLEDGTELHLVATGDVYRYDSAGDVYRIAE